MYYISWKLLEILFLPFFGEIQRLYYLNTIQTEVIFPMNILNIGHSDKKD